MQVVEDDQKTVIGRRQCQQVHHRPKEAQAFGVGVGALSRRYVGQTLGQGRNKAQKRSAAVGDMVFKQGIGGVDDQMGESLGEGLVARHQVLVAAAVEHGDAEIVGL